MKETEQSHHTVLQQIEKNQNKKPAKTPQTRRKHVKLILAALTVFTRQAEQVHKITMRICAEVDVEVDVDVEQDVGQVHRLFCLAQPHLIISLSLSSPMLTSC